MKVLLPLLAGLAYAGGCTLQPAPAVFGQAWITAACVQVITAQHRPAESIELDGDESARAQGLVQAVGRRLRTLGYAVVTPGGSAGDGVSRFVLRYFQDGRSEVQPVAVVVIESGGRQWGRAFTSAAAGGAWFLRQP